MNKRVIIDVDGNKVVARCGDKKGVARCHPDGAFEFFVGAKLALERLEEAEKPYGWLKVGMTYYAPDAVRGEMYAEVPYTADDFDRRVMELGLAFRTKEEAIECAKKMLAAVNWEG